MTPAEVAFITSLIGKPYKLGTSGPDAYDCYGLVQHVQRVIMGFTLPATSREGSIVVAIKESGERRLWERVESPQPYDIVLMANVLDRNTHMGVWVKPGLKGMVLHAWEKGGVTMHDTAMLRAAAFNQIRFFRRKPAA